MDHQSIGGSKQAKKQILLSKDNSLDSDVNNSICKSSFFPFSTISTIFESQLIAYKILFSDISSINRHLAAKSAFSFGGTK